ncbi:MAG TPA: ice-binding family protein [Bryobacteraceae bacterium]|nr:ice-binding family protein [Bryobacteraceae bacterium]
MKISKGSLVAVLAGMLVSIPCARADAFSTLAGAGSAYFGLLGLQNSDLELSAVVVTGNAGVSSGGKLNVMAPSSITGTVAKDSGATLTGPGSYGTVTTQSMTTIDGDAISAASLASGLTPYQTFTNLTSATTVSANGSTTVIDINGNINLNNANLTLNGTASDYFIVNVTGNLTLGGTASLLLSGGLTAGNVIYNFNSGAGACVLNTAVNDVINGIVLATGCGTSSLDGTWNGEIIYGGTKVTLLSNAHVNEVATVTATPEPATFLLFGLGLLSIGLARKYFRPAGQPAVARPSRS